MASVTLYSALNMDTAEFWAGDLESASSTKIVIADDLRESVITGEGFKYTPAGIVKGTIHEFEQWFGTSLNGSLEYEFTGLNTSAKAAYDLYKDDDPQGLLALALNGDDTITGSAYADVLHGFDGKDKVSGGQGNDVVHGDAGNDILAGNRGNDELHGGAGNDTLIGAVGDDNMWGGEGADKFVFADTSPQGHDTIHEWDEGDTIKFANSFEGKVTIEYDGYGNTTLVYGDNTVTVDAILSESDYFFAPDNIA